MSGHGWASFRGRRGGGDRRSRSHPIRSLGQVMAAAVLVLTSLATIAGPAGAAEVAVQKPAVATHHVDEPGLGLDVAADVVDEFVVGGNWTKAVAADWLPDGRMLVLTQSGQVHLANPETGTSALHFTVPSVDSSGERGALDLLVAPDFATTNEFFIYYSHTTNARLHIGRFVFNENGTTTRNSHQVIWQNPGPTHSQFSPYHVGGSLQIGPDGRFYLGIGDGTHPANSQSMSNVFGKILRINRDGSVPTDNPFYDAANTTNVDEIWAYGLRNPFRMKFDDDTGKLWVGDVGGNNDSTAYEEVNVVGAGQNFGWPLCEGPLSGPKAGPACPAGQGIVGPVHYYTHTIGGGCCSNRSITGGEIYRGDEYPFAHTTYLHSDYATGDFTWVTIDDATTTKLDSGPWEPAGGKSGAVNPVWLEVSPIDGYFYYIHLGWSNDGQVRRFRYTGEPVGQPPTITEASADVLSGLAPLTVSFTGAATDADGDTLTYLWDFGDGTTSTEPSPSHTFSADGVYDITLRVSDGTATVSSEPIEIIVGHPPEPIISGVSDGAMFDAGDTITFTGSATDPDDGPLPEGSLEWRIDFVHNDHIHPFPVQPSVGATTTLTVPITGHDFRGDTGYRVLLTATDSSGIPATAEISLIPNKVPLGLTTNLPIDDATVTLDGVTELTPVTVDTLQGFNHEISAPETVCVDDSLWAFDNWSDGGARTHVIAAASGTIQANYVDTGDSCDSTLVIRAHGTTGVERLEVRADNTLIDTITLNTTYTNHTLTVPASPGQIALSFINNGTTNGVDRNVRVDYIQLDGTTYQTEDPSTHSTGTWTSATGCAAGHKQSEWLHCTGTLTYTTLGGASSLSEAVALRVDENFL